LAPLALLPVQAGYPSIIHPGKPLRHWMMQERSILNICQQFGPGGNSKAEGFFVSVQAY
jgi:hypothetical protein